MGDVIDIKGPPPAGLEENQELIADCCRYAEGILSEANMKRKYGFADSVWQDLGSNEKLLAAVEDEKIHRLRSGRQKRERAQHLVVKAPDVAASIMLNDSANDRHRLDACKVLNDFSANPADNTPAASDRFQITIVLNGDVESYDKSISINADDGNDTNTTRQRVLPATVADKTWDDDDVAPDAIAPARTGYMDHHANRPPVDLQPVKPIKQKRVPATAPEKPNVYETVKTMSAAERSALKSFLEMEDG